MKTCNSKPDLFIPRCQPSNIYACYFYLKLVYMQSDFATESRNNNICVVEFSG